MPLRRNRGNDNAPVIEGATCMEEFQPAAIGQLYLRGQQLPLDHPVVKATRSFSAV
jgi:hypothetical protein